MAGGERRVLLPRLALEGGGGEALPGERLVGQQGRRAGERTGDLDPGREEAFEGVRLEEGFAQQRFDLQAFFGRERRPDLEIGGGEQPARLAARPARARRRR